jgi:allantoate deiminase
VGIIHLHVEVEGAAGHAGTTPMAGRRDALAAAAEIVLAAEAAAGAAGSGVVATVGQLAVRPGASNVIPGRCSFTLDIRDQDETVRDRACGLIQEAIAEVSTRRGARFTVQETLRVPPVPLSPRLQTILARACERERLPLYRLASGAGHDAMVLAGITEAAMLFTRCRGGISHHPAESVLPEDAIAGAQVLLDAVWELAGG